MLNYIKLPEGPLEIQCFFLVTLESCSSVGFHIDPMSSFCCGSGGHGVRLTPGVGVSLLSAAWNYAIRRHRIKLQWQVQGQRWHAVRPAKRKLCGQRKQKKRNGSQEPRSNLDQQCQIHPHWRRFSVISSGLSPANIRPIPKCSQVDSIGFRRYCGSSGVNYGELSCNSTGSKDPSGFSHVFSSLACQHWSRIKRPCTQLMVIYCDMVPI